MNIPDFLKKGFYLFKKDHSHKRLIANWIWFFREAKTAEQKKKVEQISQQLYSLSKDLGGDTFVSDGMLLWGREIGWIKDVNLLESIKASSPNDQELRIIWRTHVLTWAALQAKNVRGDFFEFGCYKGFSSFVVRHYCRELFIESEERNYFWFDLFESVQNDKGRRMDHSNSEIIAIERAKRFDDTFVFKGDVRNTFLTNLDHISRKVAFAHFDLNNFQIEYEIIKQVLSQSSTGTVLVFDDYAMTPFTKQNSEYKKLFNQLSIPILELPTGQGLVIIP